MARNDDSGDDDDTHTSAVRSAGHSRSGGHVIAQTRAVAGKSRIYHAFDDPDLGDDMAYEFHEYPKHVTVEGKLHVCNNADEEATARAGEGIVREADERKRMVALAKVKDVQVDGRWSLDKMAEAITNAGYDASADPFDGTAS